MYYVKWEQIKEEKGMRAVKKKIHWTLVKHGKTNFIFIATVEKRDFSTELNSMSTRLIDNLDETD